MGFGSRISGKQGRTWSMTSVHNTRATQCVAESLLTANRDGGHGRRCGGDEREGPVEAVWEPWKCGRERDGCSSAHTPWDELH